MKTIYVYVLVLCWKAICCNKCELSNVTIAVEKEECGFCINVNTTWCAGYCFNKDVVLKDPVILSGQSICTFKEFVYETVKVPGCANQADSLYSYPVATDCYCGKCDTKTTDCTVLGLGPSYCSFSEIKE
ncbi:follitropin subunit beta [Ornithorhynchus anatinus]|uniref:Follitropin subunit beta n=1 Tax=Ornithorhynchus anatinus TaxID=9258 RepID=A0A6I8N0P4_ORNAN|nr:follitropin subunit beta [Ornithorhynchus anatinus]